MYASAVIVFREVLEAALVISIVLAASHGIRGRNLMVLAGGGAGMVGAALVAGFAGAITGAVQGMGQELFNASVLAIAVVMLAWHNIWMARHARSMVAGLNQTGTAVRAGERPLYFLGVVTALAILREGSEVVLFLYGVAAGGSAARPMLAGGLVGLAVGVSFGAGLYFGLLKIPARHLFSWTSWMILLLAAGMASQAVGFLLQAGIVPDQAPLWSSAGWLPPDSVLGEFLHALIGYEAEPVPVQLSVWLATLGLILFGMYRFGRSPPVAVTEPASA